MDPNKLLQQNIIFLSSTEQINHIIVIFLFFFDKEILFIGYPSELEH